MYAWTFYFTSVGTCIGLVALAVVITIDKAFWSDKRNGDKD